ncbi:MAG: beta-ketoacyl-ACP synthase II [Candidatus Omnitrophica bacterium]|nr:beta-ketoacyl-ACP synthase II [Candidatus Omnitrophota bacterium]
MSERRVVVTGLGSITPIGLNTADTWAALKTGKSGVSRITQFDPTGLDCHIAAEIKGFEPTSVISVKEARRMERFTQLAVAAAFEAWKDAGFSTEASDPAEREDWGVVIGSGIGSLSIIEKHHSLYLEHGTKKFSPFMIPMLIINMASGWVSMLLGLKGPNMAAVTACATANHAIGEAFRKIQRGDATVMVSGGTESCITPLGVGGFCALRALSKRNDAPEQASRPFDKDRDGFVMGEGAGIVVLEEYEHAKKRGARIYAELAGYSATGDAYHMTAPHPEGDGAMRAMKLALKDAKLNPEDIDYVNAHGTSTEMNDQIETLAIKRAFGDHAKKLQISSTKSMTGHLLGAAGGVEFVACCKSITEDVLHPTINQTTPDPDCDLDYIPNTTRECRVRATISNSFGFGGHNTCLVLKKV